MTVEADGNPLVAILQHCGRAAPQPWYPSSYAREKGIDRDSLDPHLDRLRMGGLVQLTDWMQDIGQGYRLTPEGERVLNSPRDLAILTDGKLPQTKIVEQVAAPRGTISAWDRGEAIRDALLDPQPPRATQLLLFANIAVFAVGLLLAGRQGLFSQFLSGASAGGLEHEKLWTIQHDLGAITGADLVHGQWWKLLTCCFVHFGALHLLVNMYTLYILGPQSERMWGRWRFVLLYFICGLAGSCSMVWINPEAFGAGASGALWGLMTSYLAWVFFNRAYLPGALSPERLRSWLSVLLINVFISMMPGISAAAHFGGGGAGVIAAWLLNTERFRTGAVKAAAILGIILLPAVCVGAVYRSMKTDPHWQFAVRMEETRQSEGERKGFSSSAQRVLETMNRANKVYKESLEPVIDKRVQQRTPEMIQGAVDKVSKQLTDLMALEASLDKRTYTDPDFENARQVGKAYVESGLEFFRQARRALEATEPDVKKEDAALRAADAKWKQSKAAWDRLFK